MFFKLLKRNFLQRQKKNPVGASYFLLGKTPFGFIALWLVGWLVGCFGFNGPLRQYFSLYQAVSQREGERGEKG